MAQADAAVLRTAMKGMGTDEKAIISVLGHRQPQEIDAIAISFKQQFDHDLIEDLKHEVGDGNFGKLTVGIVQSWAMMEAVALHSFIAGMGTNEAGLIEVLVGRSNAELTAIRKAYRARFDKDLETEIKKELSGDIRTFFDLLLDANRDEAGATHKNVTADVQLLYDAGEGKFGTDEKKFVTVFTSRSFAVLKNICEAYGQKHGYTVEKVVKKETSGLLEKSLLAFVRYVNDPYTYFADLFESSMSGVGTNDEMLIRLAIRFRHPQVLINLKKAYLQKYGKSLVKRIEGETSGDYEKLLVALIGN